MLWREPAWWRSANADIKVQFGSEASADIFVAPAARFQFSVLSARIVIYKQQQQQHQQHQHLLQQHATPATSGGCHFGLRLG